MVWIPILKQILSWHSYSMRFRRIQPTFGMHLRIKCVHIVSLMPG